MNRLEEKNKLFVKLGALFGPLERLIENPDQYNEQEKSETLARYFAEHNSLQEDFRSFSTGQPGHNYAIEFNNFFNALHGVLTRLIQKQDLESVVREQLSIALFCIDAVPIPSTSVILEAGSPFTAYCRLRELCEVDATRCITWLDPYMDKSIFYRYLEGVRNNVPITLVTCEPGPNAGRRNVKRWNDFLDLSRLVAQERGGSLYRLVVQSTLHDRWVIYDEKRIYSLGGSAKDASVNDYFTITTVEQSPGNLDKVQDNIDTGAEYFGPNVTVHK